VSEPSVVPLSEQSFTASTPDGSVFVRVAVRGHVLGVQLEPQAMGQPAHELAERIMTCADVAYLEGQVAIRHEWERARLTLGSLDGMPTVADLDAARDRLSGLARKFVGGQIQAVGSPR
jgi:Protein of unknown function (DUF2694)